MRRAVVAALAKVDEALDVILYRPAIVKAFSWLPRWWLCDLAKASMALDERWGTRWWEAGAVAPGGGCQACRRRAAIHVYGGDHLDPDPVDDYLGTHPVYLCGWCRLEDPVTDGPSLRRELDSARQRSVSWRWRPE